MQRSYVNKFFSSKKLHNPIKCKGKILEFNEGQCTERNVAYELTIGLCKTNEQKTKDKESNIGFSSREKNDIVEQLAKVRQKKQDG